MKFDVIELDIHAKVPVNLWLSNGALLTIAVIAYIPVCKCCAPDVIIVYVGEMTIDGVVIVTVVKLAPPPFAAYEAVRAYEADSGINVIDVAALAVVANDDDKGVNVIEVAALDVVAKLLLPNNDPVNPEGPKFVAPDTISEPERIVLPVISKLLKLPESV